MYRVCILDRDIFIRLTIFRVQNFPRYTGLCKIYTEFHLTLLQNFLYITQPTYQIRLNEIYNLCDFYGESRKYGTKYAHPIINSHTHYFISKKKTTFKEYVNSKIESQREEQ